MNMPRKVAHTAAPISENAPAPLIIPKDHNAVLTRLPHRVKPCAMVGWRVRFLLTTATLSLAFAGCGPKNTPANAVRPAEVKAGETLNDGKSGVGSAGVTCTPSDDDAPLIIDLDGTDRKLLSQLIAKKQV